MTNAAQCTWALGQSCTRRTNDAGQPGRAPPKWGPGCPASTTPVAAHCMQHPPVQSCDLRDDYALSHYGFLVPPPLLGLGAL